jgi:hypothetical protein
MHTRNVVLTIHFDWTRRYWSGQCKYYWSRPVGNRRSGSRYWRCHPTLKVILNVIKIRGCKKSL